MNLAQIAAEAEQVPGPVSPGTDLFRGYGVMGVHFATGHVLALRRFPSSSIGPGYTSVWVRDPAGAWSFYADVDPDRACGRYFGPALQGMAETPIRLSWAGPRSLAVDVPAIGLTWSMEFGHSAMSWAMDAVARRIPEAVMRRPSVLAPLTLIASRALRLGKVRMRGTMPNGQPFMAVPRRLITVASSSASLRGSSLGVPVEPDVQASIGEFIIPRRGLLVVGLAEMSPPNTDHLALVTQMAAEPGPTPRPTPETRSAAARTRPATTVLAA